MWIIRQFVREGKPVRYYGPYDSASEAEKDTLKLRGCMSIYKVERFKEE